jgi:branched-chain amino acid transport system ATP-binding protein
MTDGTEPTSGDASSVAPPLLSASNIQVRYRNGALGISDVSIDVYKGQTVALLGPNGAGKTTTIRAISGFLRSEGSRIVRGTVQFDGRDISNFEPHRASALGIFCVPERRKIFPNLTVLENLLALGHHVRGAHRAALLDRVFQMFPVLAARRGSSAGLLSGGEQQMLAISRALMSESTMLLVDEMTLGLHTSLKPVLYEALQEINKSGITVLLSDESADFALSVCDYCYIIRGGSITNQGRASEFIDNDQLVVGYLG